MPASSKPREFSRDGTRVRFRVLSALVLILAFALGAATRARAATYYVDAANPNASDVGPGSSAAPYRTIQAAINARAGAGVTIAVRPGIYREALTVSRSGAEGDPFVLMAESAGVVVSGADDFSNPALWTPVSGDVYLAASVTWSPGQVFADGTRLTLSTTTPSALPARTFQYVSGSGLYVNAGGGNPGTHGCQVGRRTKGIEVLGWYVVVSGFAFTSTEDRAVAVTASHVAIRNCAVTWSHRHGIVADRCDDLELSNNTSSDNHDHGIYLLRSTNSVVSNNQSHHNARPAVRAANGIDVEWSPGARIENNLCHDNQDSGIQFYNGSNGCLSRNNISWSNGDHGYDHLRSTGVRHFHDVAWGNFKDGFSYEGESPNGALYNSIAVDNGLGVGEFDLWVDSTSAVGFSSDYNIVWNSTTQNPFKWVASRYATIDAYRLASGQDAHTLQVDPEFSQPSAGNFHLRASSPAIDAARTDVAGWPALDIDGFERFDDPNTPNHGVGAITFADRGAHEYRSSVVSGQDHDPVVIAPVALAAPSGSPLAFTVTAADSDGDAIQSLTADLSSLPAGSGATFIVAEDHASGAFRWTPPSTAVRTAPYTVTFTATNARTGTATTAITVTAPVTSGNLCGNPDFESSLTGWSHINSTLARVSGGHGGSWALEARASGSGVFGTGDEPSWVLDIPAAGTRYRFACWVRSASNHGSARIKLREYLGSTQQGSTVYSTPVTLSTTWQQLTVEVVSRAAHSRYAFDIEDTPVSSGERLQMDDVTIFVPAVDRAPVVTAPSAVTVAEGKRASVTVTAADPDGDAIVSLTANVSGLPAGSDAAFTVDPSRTSATFTWTPTASDGRSAPYTVAFTAANALSGSASTAITVNDVPAGGGNLATNPDFETSLAGWASLGQSTLTRVTGGHGGTYCVQAVAPAASTYGITDSPSMVPVVAAPNLVYRLSAWVRSPASSGNAKIKVREFANGVQQGSSAYSAPLPLSPSWQLVTFDYATRTAGSYLDVEVNDYPVASGETIQIDDVAMVLLGPEQARAAAQRAGEAPASAVLSVRWIADARGAGGVLRLAMPRPGPVDLRVFDVGGRRIAAPLVDGFVEAGTYDLPLGPAASGERVRPGAYFYRLRGTDGVKTGRFVVLE